MGPLSNRQIIMKLTIVDSGLVKIEPEILWELTDLLENGELQNKTYIFMVPQLFPLFKMLHLANSIAEWRAEKTVQFDHRFRVLNSFNTCNKGSCLSV